MTRLIDADALLESFKNADCGYGFNDTGVKDIITNAPTVQREGWVSVPIEPTEEMIRKALAVEFPCSYKTYLRNPANGPKTTKYNEAQILRVTKQYAAFISAAPKE